MPATFRCYQLKPSKDAWKRCINLMSPKYSVLVAENKGFSSRNYLGLLVVGLGLFCQASRYRTRFQASSGNSDSANRPGYEVERHPFRAGPPCIGAIIGSTLGSFWVAGFLVDVMLGLFLIIPLPWSKKSWVKWPSQYSHWEENYPVLILETVAHSKATDILV